MNQPSKKKSEQMQNITLQRASDIRNLNWLQYSHQSWWFSKSFHRLEPNLLILTGNKIIQLYKLILVIVEKIVCVIRAGSLFAVLASFLTEGTETTLRREQQVSTFCSLYTNNLLNK